jgi:hypothetical protein
MVTRLVSAIVCIPLLSACTQTSEIGYDSEKTPPEEMFRFVEGKDVVITLRDSSTRVGNVRLASLDTLQILEDDSVSATKLPMESIREIRVGGSALGPVVGLLAGGCIGGLLGRKMGEDVEGATEGKMFHGLTTGVYGVVGGGIGAVMGVLIEAYVTPAYEFLLP